MDEERLARRAGHVPHDRRGENWSSCGCDPAVECEHRLYDTESFSPAGPDAMTVTPMFANFTAFRPATPGRGSDQRAGHVGRRWPEERGRRARAAPRPGRGRSGAR